MSKYVRSENQTLYNTVSRLKYALPVMLLGINVSFLYQLYVFGITYYPVIAG